MPTAFRQTATLADCTGRYRTSIVLATRLYGEDWSDAGKREHCEREGRINPIRALDLTATEWDAMEADSSLRFGYVDKAGDVDSPFTPEPWMAAPGLKLDDLK